MAWYFNFFLIGVIIGIVVGYIRLAFYYDKKNKDQGEEQ